jgi:dihydrofolate reductase
MTESHHEAPPTPEAAGRPLTQYFVASSLDGFIADEHDNLDWLMQLDGGLEDASNPYEPFIANVGALAMGATTYEWIQRHDPGEWPYEDRPTWVFTHRDLDPIRGADLRFTDDVPGAHADMLAAAGRRNVWLVGGGDLVGQFLDHDLLDEIWLSLAPVVLGRGAPLLPRRRTQPMTLQAVTGGPQATFVHLRYSLR